MKIREVGRALTEDGLQLWIAGKIAVRRKFRLAASRLRPQHRSVIRKALVPSEKGRAIIVAPTFKRERALIKKGVWPVAGCDEAGRGPLAGPVVAAAVILDPARIPKGMDDSKKLTREKREELFEQICATSLVSVAVAPPSRIDRDNILRASLWALARAVRGLSDTPKHVFVDGRDRIDVTCECAAVIGGDALVLSIAAASIVAKVSRDRLMCRLAHEHPEYGFDSHMGYGVPQHLAALDRLGPTIHHRRFFAPVMAARMKHEGIGPDQAAMDLAIESNVGTVQGPPAQGLVA